MTTYRTKPSKYGPLMPTKDIPRFIRRGISIEDYWLAKTTRKWGVQEFIKRVEQIKRNQQADVKNKAKNRKVVDL